MPDVPADRPDAATRWSDQLLGWGLPDWIVEQAPETPWGHDARRFAVDDTLDREATSARWAREVLPPAGGTVLDVGCGGGRSSVVLVPPANELIGVDRSGAMLDAFLDAAAGVGAARRTVHGAWPDIAPQTPVADVVVCNHVLYDVADVVPFVLALTDHARLAVVVEIPTVPPMSAWAPAWRHFWGIERPDGPTADDLIAVLDELELEPEHTVGPRGPVARFANDPGQLLATARRRLCLPAERDAELAGWLAEHPLPWPDTVATIRWPGTGAA
jgi:SAM-dependent methyltransferase